MKWLLALVVPVFLASCADKPFASVPAPPRAKAVDVTPAREAVERANDATTRSREKTAKAEVHLERAAESVKDADLIAGEAFEKGMVAGGELADRLKVSIKRIGAELMDARETIAELSESLRKTSTELQVAQGSIATVQADAAVKQNEVETVRDNLSTVNGRLEASEIKRVEKEAALVAEETVKGLWRAAALIGWAIILIVIIWKVSTARVPRIG